MKVYVICFDNEWIRYPKVFLDRELAKKRLKEMQDQMDKQAKKYKDKSYSHWISVDEMEVEFGEAQPMTLEEVYDL